MQGPTGVRATAVEDLGVYYEGDRPDLRALVPPTARRVLDVGCGAGSVGAALKRDLGAWVAGIELFPQAVEIARSRLDELIVADLDTVTDLPADLDVAIFGDVLEHLRDPARLLRVTAEHLAADGLVVASVPNVKHWSVLVPLLVHDRFAYGDSGLLDRTHVHLFTLEELERSLAEAGLEPVSVCAHRIPMPAGAEALVDAAARMGAEPGETRARLEAYQYLVTARLAA
jgi:2-polyprenyl-3-methyl-5-hydroxy-6-metoxy-1,4-benzoquinol methylase